MPLAKDVKLEELAKQTEGFTGADIEAVCKEAGMEALRDAKLNNKKISSIDMKYFKKAIDKIKKAKGDKK